MAVKGEQVTAQYFNDLFAQLKRIRDEHAARADLTSAQKANLNALSPTNIQVGEITKTSNTVQVIKSGLNTLASNGTGISSTFSSNITIPSVGSLLYPVSAAVDNLNAADEVCPNCAHFTSASSRGHFSSNFSSDFSSDFTSVQSRSHFTAHFTADANRGTFDAYFSSNANRSHFSSNFLSAGQRGAFGSHFTSSSQKGNFTNFTNAANRSHFSSVAG